MTLERVREQLASGVTYAEALQKIRATTVFTTHTPVPAGNDMFPPYLMERYFRGYLKSFGVSQDIFFGLGQEMVGVMILLTSQFSA